LTKVNNALNIAMSKRKAAIYNKQKTEVHEKMRYTRSYTQRYGEIGKRIAYYRVKRGLSQQELGEKIHCSEEDINNIENYGANSIFKKKSPWSRNNMMTLMAIADSLELELVLFFLPITEENFDKYRTDK